MVHAEWGSAVLDAVLVVGVPLGGVVVAINDAYGHIESYLFCYGVE